MMGFMANTSRTFDAWTMEVDRLCRAHLGCGWNDLCGDKEPLERSYGSGESPVDFVRWWRQKYDLELLEPLADPNN
jgi:hypothetical protein